MLLRVYGRWLDYLLFIRGILACPLVPKALALLHTHTHTPHRRFLWQQWWVLA